MDLAIRELVAAEQRARADIDLATAARTEAANRRALVIARLVETLGPKKAAERLGLAVSALQKPVGRAKDLREGRPSAPAAAIDVQIHREYVVVDADTTPDEAAHYGAYRDWGDAFNNCTESRGETIMGRTVLGGPWEPIRRDGEV